MKHKFIMYDKNMILKIILKNIKKEKLLAFISIFSLFIVLFSSTLLDYMYDSIKNILISKNIWEDQTKFIITKWKHSFLANLKYNNKLDKVYKQLKNDKNIEKIYWFYTTKIPTLLEVNFFGYNFSTDIFVYASDKIIDKNKEYINLWINPILLNIYNSQVANDSKFPKLSLSLIKNIAVNLDFWRNSFFILEKQEKKKAYITYMYNDFSMLWITISKKTADKISQNLQIPQPKLFKIVWKVKNKKYIDKLIKKYPKVSIKWYNEIVKKVENKLQSTKKIFLVIKILLYTTLISFIISLSMNILFKNKNNIKVFYYHNASFLKQFLLPMWELFIYIFIAFILTSILITNYNLSIDNINYLLEKLWVIWINLEKINYNILIKNSSFIVLFSILTMFIIFLKERKKYR